MSTKHLVALSLVLVSSATLAQETLSTVEVRAELEGSLIIACNNPIKPNLKDVERILHISEAGEAPGFRNQLMRVAAEACKAGVPKIQVARAVNGQSLTWKATPVASE